MSGQDFPYQDTKAPIREIIARFGPERLMWGSDFPWVTEKCGYTKAWNIMEDDFFMSEEEKKWVMGGTFLSLFPELAPKEA